ncbi:MAG: hypothetical protein ABI921_05365 [Panacibacter sp.]
MKTQFIKLVCLDETIDGSVTINVSNISTIRRINYNDVVQTMIQMVGGEKFGVNELPEELVEMMDQESMTNAEFR